MNLAKVSANEQITVPLDIRRSLGLTSGDRVPFFQKQDGNIAVSNISAHTIRKAQDAFDGAAAGMSVAKSDVQALVDELRYGNGRSSGYLPIRTFCFHAALSKAPSSTIASSAFTRRGDSC